MAEHFRVLVCGGRNFDDVGAVHAALDAIHSDRPITHLIEGGAAGVDRAAYAWARKLSLDTRCYRADWNRYGKAAGPMRNRLMLEDGNPDLVVAFPGGPGTANMKKLAQAAGVPVAEPLSKPEAAP